MAQDKGMDYKIQKIWFLEKPTYRILQNVGGPCPLIGLCNIMLLANDIRVNKHVQTISFKDLTGCLEDHLQKLLDKDYTSNPKVTEEQTASAIQNVQDCIQLFPKLEEGLDINVRFNDCNSFEFTPQVAMFDAYNVRILHGWVIDPQDKVLHDLIGPKSYNEIVDWLTNDQYDKDLTDQDVAKIETDKQHVRNFLNDYSQQLTVYGLHRIHEVMNHGQLAIFFRNNHFSTIYKHKDIVFELVTDEGIVDADGRITWQTLSELSGDTQFVANNFQLLNQIGHGRQHYQSKPNPPSNPPPKQNQNQNQNEQNNQNSQQSDQQSDNTIIPSAPPNDDDENDEKCKDNESMQKDNQLSQKLNEMSIDSDSNHGEADDNIDNNNNNNDNDTVVTTQKEHKPVITMEEQEKHLKQLSKQKNDLAIDNSDYNDNISQTHDSIAQDLAIAQALEAQNGGQQNQKSQLQSSQTPEKEKRKLEQELGLKVGEYDSFMKSQSDAMNQLEIQKKTPKNNNLAEQQQNQNRQNRQQNYPNQHRSNQSNQSNQSHQSNQYNRGQNPYNQYNQYNDHNQNPNQNPTGDMAQYSDFLRKQNKKKQSNDTNETNCVIQ